MNANITDNNYYPLPGMKEYPLNGKPQEAEQQEQSKAENRKDNKER